MSFEIEELLNCCLLVRPEVDGAADNRPVLGGLDVSDHLGVDLASR